MNGFKEKIIDNRVLTSFVVFLGATFVVVIVTFVLYGYEKPFLENILVEAHGMLFDILIIGILILWLNQLTAKRFEIRRYRDEIDDFRDWESEEAKFRIVGNIKRLNRNGVSTIDLMLCYLKKAMLVKAHLEGANFCLANLEGASLHDAHLEEATLYEAHLEEADLSEAHLEEANLAKAHLGGANLEDANLEGANLEGAKGLTGSQLCKAKTLYMAELDDDLKKEIKQKYPNLLEKPVEEE